jgi:2'-5' RNA ligase
VAALEALVADLSTRLARAGHAAEPRPFVPHLTLGRVRAPRGARGLADAIARGWTGPAIPWRAGSLTLFRSHLGPGGARHEPLLVAPLGAPGAAGPELRSRP